MKATTISIELAKEVFQVHGVDEHGKRLFNKQAKRSQIASFFIKIPLYLIGMEVYAPAHLWANKLQGLGQHVKLIAPQSVKPYVKINKHDAADAETIREVVTRPNMRFVPIKNPEQQAVLALHLNRQEESSQVLPSTPASLQPLG